MYLDLEHGMSLPLEEEAEEKGDWGKSLPERIQPKLRAELRSCVSIVNIKWSWTMHTT